MTEVLRSLIPRTESPEPEHFFNPSLVARATNPYFTLSMPKADFTTIKISDLQGYLFFGRGANVLLAFVPETLVSAEGELATDKFLADRWPYANNYANPEAAGSHVWPDMERPAPLSTPGLDVFVERLTDRLAGRA